MANAAEQNPLIGFIMLLGAMWCSGFASVYTEKIFKGTGKQETTSLWLQNMLLSVFTMVIMVVSWGMATALPFKEHVYTTRTGAAYLSPFSSFTAKTWLLVLNNVIGGLLSALSIKYADNVLRGFASGCATIAAALMSVHFFAFTLEPFFMLGALVVVGSSMLYGSVIKCPGEWWNQECTCVCFPAKEAPYEAGSTVESLQTADDSNKPPASALGVLQSTIAQLDGVLDKGEVDSDAVEAITAPASAAQSVLQSTMSELDRILDEEEP